jgi:hypothetical protein
MQAGRPAGGQAETGGKLPVWQAYRAVCQQVQAHAGQALGNLVQAVSGGNKLQLQVACRVQVWSVCAVDGQDEPCLLLNRWASKSKAQPVCKTAEPRKNQGATYHRPLVPHTQPGPGLTWGTGQLGGGTCCKSQQAGRKSSGAHHDARSFCTVNRGRPGGPGGVSNRTG